VQKKSPCISLCNVLDHAYSGILLILPIPRARRKEDEEEAERPLVPSPLWKLGFRPKGTIFSFIL
jgi:hypothetical protein